LHGKINDGWRHALAEFVNTESAVNKTLDVFENKSNGMAASASWTQRGTGGLAGLTCDYILETMHWNNDREHILRLCHDSLWSGGSFFCTDIAMLEEAFKNFDIKKEMQLVPIGRGYVDPSRLHFLERVFGIACAYMNRNYVAV
jgi:hypothetical protein